MRTNTTLTLLALALSPMIALSACGKKEDAKPAGVTTKTTLGDVKKSAQDTAAKAGDAFNEQRQQLADKVSLQLSEANKTLKALRDKAAAATDSAKADLDKAVQTLAAKRDALQKKLADITAATSDGWDHVKSSVESAVNDVKKAVDDAGAKLSPN